MFIKKEEWEEKRATNRALLKDNEAKRIIIDKLTRENEILKETNYNLRTNEQIMLYRLGQNKFEED